MDERQLAEYLALVDERESEDECRRGLGVGGNEDEPISRPVSIRMMRAYSKS